MNFIESNFLQSHFSWYDGIGSNIWTRQVFFSLAEFSTFSAVFSRETELAALPEAEHVWPIPSQTGGWWRWWGGGGALHPPIPYLSRKVYCCRSRAAAPRFMLQLSQGRGITQGAGAVHMDAAACHQTHRHTSKKENLPPDPLTHLKNKNLTSDPPTYLE